MRKGDNAGYKHFLHFLLRSQNSFLSGSLTLSFLLTTQEAFVDCVNQRSDCTFFVDSVDQDQTAHSVQSDL